jgi:hypothetical protein
LPPVSQGSPAVNPKNNIYIIFKGAKHMTPSELKEKNTALYEQVFEAGRQEGFAKIKAQSDQEIEKAIKEAQKTALEWLGVIAGADARAKMEAVLESGMTAEQLRASQELFGKNPEPGTTTGTRQQILAGLKKASLPFMNIQGKSFSALVCEYQEKEGCKKSQAIEAVAAACPDLHQEWLSEQQKR